VLARRRDIFHAQPGLPKDFPGRLDESNPPHNQPAPSTFKLALGICRRYIKLALRIWQKYVERVSKAVQDVSSGPSLTSTCPDVGLKQASLSGFRSLVPVNSEHGPKNRAPTVRGNHALVGRAKSPLGNEASRILLVAE